MQDLRNKTIPHDMNGMQWPFYFSSLNHSNVKHWSNISISFLGMRLFVKLDFLPQEQKMYMITQMKICLFIVISLKQSNTTILQIIKRLWTTAKQTIRHKNHFDLARHIYHEIWCFSSKR